LTEVAFQLHHKNIKPPFVVLKTDVTESEFFEFASEDLSSELLNGVLHVYSPASVEHERIFRFLLSLFNDYLQRQNLGEILGSHVVMRLGPKDIPEPDLLVILKESQARLKETYIDGPADLVVEIISPSTRDIDLKQKCPLYLAHGVREVWIIDPVSKNLTLYRSDGESVIYKGQDRVISSIIPGFWIKVDWIWPESAIKTYECMNEILAKIKEHNM